MTALHQAIEYSALGWVKPELDETLRLARVEIEGFAEDPADASRMRVCAEFLHQVQGTLRMVELYAPAMVAEEMERLSEALEQGRVDDRDGACSALLRAVVQLPDYLERLQSGHKEISIVLLPVLNELRGARGEHGLSESALFTPDLDRDLPISAPKPAPQPAATRAAEVTPYLVRLRDVLQAWPEQGAPSDAEGLHFALEALLARTSDEPQRRMLWVAAQVASALRDRGMTASAGLRQAFASVEREARRPYENDGFGSPRAEATLEPTRQLLYHVAHSDAGHPAIDKLRDIFDLESLKPTESELDHARGSIAGRNRALLDTVAAAVKEDLLRVKDALDLYLRTGQKDPRALQPQADALTRVSDTLGMLGLGLARNLVQQQRDEMQEIVGGARKADESALLEIAGALLYVDASLDAQVQRLASGDGEGEGGGGDDLTASEAGKVMEVLLREAILNFATARQAFVAFVETAWNHVELAPVPKLLEDVSGALRILELPLAAEYLDGVRLYTDVELIGRRRIPNSRQLDTFADALASLEYYLEALGERRANRDDILDIARNSLETLGYWPLPTPAQLQAASAAPAPAPTPVPAATVVATTAVAPALAAANADQAPADIVPETPAAATADDALAGLELDVIELDAAMLATPAELASADDAKAGDLAIADLEMVELDRIDLEQIDLESADLQAADLQAADLQAADLQAADLQAADLQASDLDLSELEALGLDAETLAAAERALMPPAAEAFGVELPAALAPSAPAHATPAETAPAAPLSPIEAIEAIAPIMPAVAASPAPAAAVGFESASDDIDEEIREIFLEEFEEEIGNLRRLLPAWRAAPDNLELMYPVRRVFHTLKGSGRLVGAKTLGEFSWKIESMLNKVRDGLRPPSPAVLAMTEQASTVLPQLHAALRGDAPVTADLAGMEALAERIGGGEEIMPSAALLSAPAAAVQAPAAVEDKAEPAVEAAEPAGVLPVAAGVAFSVDPLLLEILQTEVEGHLKKIGRWLDRAYLGPTQADEPLVRAIHTMNGAFAMTEVPCITDALTPAEGYVRRLLQAGQVVDAEGVDAIGRLAERVRETIDALSISDARVPDCSALAQDLERLRDRLPEPQAATAIGIEFDTHDTADLPKAVGVEAVELTGLDLSAFAGMQTLAPETAPEPSVPAPSAELSFGELGDIARETARDDDDLSRLLVEALDIGDTPAPAAQTPDPHAVSDASEARRLLDLVGSFETEAGIDPVAAEFARQEEERRVQERLEAERLAALRAREHEDFVRQESERLAAEQRLEAERAEAERLEAERLEAERLEAERLEAERLEAERFEAERLEAERLEAERLEAERLEAERLEAERLEAERLEAERLEAERLEAERLEAERLEAERLEAERLEAERLEAERLEAERLEAERLEAERLEAERLEAERLEAERLEAERLEAERLEAERAETDSAHADGTADSELDALEAALLEAERLAAEEDDALGEALLPSLSAETGQAAQPADANAAGDVAFLDFSFDEPTPAEAAEAEDRALADIDVSAFLPPIAAHVSDDTPALIDLPQLVAASEDPDAPLDMADLDAELIDIFVEEGQDLLDHSDQLLVRLREMPSDREVVVGLQRDLHTLKGGARMAGVMPIGELGHTMESLLEAVAEQRTQIGVSDIPLLERGFDRLHAMVTRVGAGRAIGMPERLIAEFDARVAGRPYVPEPDAILSIPAEVAEPIADAPGAPELSEEVTAEQTVAPTVPATLPPLRPLPSLADAPVDDDVGLRGSQEQVRVRAELLDRLVNYAGEVAIYRSRLEQQLGAFRTATAEMEQTNIRLRDQLRRLEIETEAQIIARYQREGDQKDNTFDPLELDRFSTLQQLSRALAETATDLSSLQSTLDDLTQQYETLLLQQSRVSSELQEGLMRTRMVPFDTVVPRLRRVLRQAATDTGKRVQLRLDGAQGELDRNVLERMTAPLEHMLRNSVAHGLESPEGRTAAGKADEGYVRIAIRKEGSEVVLQISDDGRGLDRDAIRERAETRGLIRKGAPVSPAQLDAMILEPGFSTASEVSRLAGRGVGMDVVASEVRQLGGSLDIHSVKGQGTTFTLRLPQTLAVTQAAFVRIGETIFAVPIASVRGVGRMQRQELDKPGISYRYGADEYVLHDLGKLIGQAPAKAEGQLQMPLLLTRSGDLHVAVTVDQILGNREIVVKPIGPQVASIPGIFGATIMGDGSVVVILDIAPLVRRQAALLSEDAPAETETAPEETRQVPLVMVVDDSITMRKVTGRVLERNNFEVMTAKDGLDALERMAERVPDLMLLDIEMPRMDGYELATAMKADPRLAKVPIIMITSRTGDKHRQRAMDIGVDRYLGKPYQENELMRNVFSLLETVRAHG